MPLRIGIVPPDHPDWAQIEAFLKPAAERGNVPVLEDWHAVWVVYGDDLLGAATVRRTTGGWGEVVLVGGKDHRRWIHELDDLIGRWLRDEGMTAVRAYGRKGWRKVLTGWTVIGEDNGITAIERPL